MQFFCRVAFSRTNGLHFLVAERALEFRILTFCQVYTGWGCGEAVALFSRVVIFCFFGRVDVFPGSVIASLQ